MIYITFLLLGCATWTFSTVAAGGAAMIMLPLASLLISIRVVVPAIAVGSAIGSVHRAYLFRSLVRWDVLSFVLPGVILGSIIGGFLFSQLELKSLSLFVAGFLIFHVLRSFARPLKPSFKMERWYFFPAAFFTAVISSIVGASGPVMNPFYLNSGIEKESIIATKAFSSLIMHITKVASYMAFINLPRETLEIGAMIGIGALGGNLIGKRILTNMSLKNFKIVADLVILASATLMIVKQLS